MANLLKLRLGVSDDPTALQPNLNDCLAAVLQHAELLTADVLEGLRAAASPAGAKRVVAFQSETIQQALRDLASQGKAAGLTYKTHLTRIVYEGGGKEQVQGEMLRYEDLQLFGDSELDQSIELARAQQEVSLAVDDVLPALDSLISTLLGWRTIQSGLNPLRPEVFVRALQATLAEHVPESSVREALITPAAGLLGVNLRRLYRELADWLKSCGVEPAVPVGGRLYQGSGATGKAATNSVSNTLLTLDRLRLLLAGDLDAPRSNDQMLTVPASLVALQDLKQVDAMVQRLQKRPRPEPAVRAMVPGEERQGVAADAMAGPRLGHQLAEEVVRLMFDNLLQDQRLMPEFKQKLKLMQPAVLTLAQHDSRFFSDRSHPARLFLDRLTQRSLAFSSASDDGWQRFLGTVEDSLTWLDSKIVDAEVFGELIDHLQARWGQHDEVVRGRREGAARALLHAEQRNLLAQKLATDFANAIQANDVPPFVGEFLKGSWAQVVAEAQLSCVDGSDDPYGYRAVVDDLIWSVQPHGNAARGRNQRLAQMIPVLLARLRDGLKRIDYPPELTDRFFDNLLALHQAALDEGREPGDPTAKDLQALSLAMPHPDSQAIITDGIGNLDDLVPDPVAEPVAEPPAAPAVVPGAKGPWLAEDEAEESGYLDEGGYLPDEAPQIPDQLAEQLPDPVGAAELRTGTWVELMANGDWLRVQLTWASPHATLFMFTSLSGSAHSMSRRTLERLRGQGMMKVVAERNVVDDALDQVAKTALRNSFDDQA